MTNRETHAILNRMYENSEVPKRRVQVAVRESDEETRSGTDEDASTEYPLSVVLFNDEVNTFENVIRAVMRAIHCSEEVAEHIAMAAHNSGKALVTTGDKERVDEVASVLRAYKLTVEIQKA